MNLTFKDGSIIKDVKRVYFRVAFFDNADPCFVLEAEAGLYSSPVCTWLAVSDLKVAQFVMRNYEKAVNSGAQEWEVPV